MMRLGKLLLHPAKPVRAIFLHRVAGFENVWQAEYRGDRWTPAFRTATGERWLVRSKILEAGVRHGLPIVDDDGPQPPFQHAPLGNGRFGNDWPGGFAA